MDKFILLYPDLHDGKLCEERCGNILVMQSNVKTNS